MSKIKEAKTSLKDAKVELKTANADLKNSMALLKEDPINKDNVKNAKQDFTKVINSTKSVYKAQQRLSKLSEG